ncbi:MAG TPA: hypothetical protein VF230_12185 [Acidimicrobiales bacterium]
MSASWFRRAFVAVLRRPDLWFVAIAQLFRLAPTGWWRARPHLPVPDPAYLRFRLQTQYGDAEREPEPADVVAYLEWCRGYRRVAG